MPTISYKQENCSFVYRVAAVIIDGKRVLLHRSPIDEIWCLPGGHVEMMEDSLQALQREIREETGEALVIERLLWIVENFFIDDRMNHHELGLYYLAHLEDGSRFLVGDGPFYGSEDFEDDQPMELVFRWFPLDAKILQNEPIYPIFLRQGLTRLPEFPEHVLDVH